MIQNFFSIITPTIIRKTTERALKSVQNQIYRNFEHIVIVDGDITEDEKKIFIKRYNTKIIFLPDRYNDYGNTPRHIARDYISKKCDYILYLDDDCYYYPASLGVLNNRLQDKPAWGVFTQLRFGEPFLNEPANCKTDINQVFHKPIINNNTIKFPAEHSQATDGTFVESLKIIAKPAILDTIPLVIYEKLNYGKKDV